MHKIIKVLIFGLFFFLVSCSNTKNNTTLKVIEFDTTGGSLIATIEANKGDLVDEPSQPLKDGYNFVQWYYDSSFSEKVIWPITLNDDLVLFADWEAKIYQIDYFIYEGYDEVISLEVTYGSVLPLFTPPIKEDYVFDGFYTQQNAQGRQIYDKDMKPLIHWDYNNNLTVYANWLEVPYETANEIKFEEEVIGMLDLFYGKYYTIFLPTDYISSEQTFLYYYIIDDNDEIILTNANGESLIPWQYKTNQVIYAKILLKISTADDLMSIDLTKEYVFTNDIEINMFNQSIDSHVDSGFTGIINGQGHKLIFEQQQASLFKNNYGEIKDLQIVITNLYLTPLAKTAGFAVYNHGLIENVSFESKIVNASFGIEFGGIAGFNYGLIKQASSIITLDDTFTGRVTVGGIAYENAGIIDQSFASLSIKSKNLREQTASIGGIGVTQTTTGKITNSYTAVNIDSKFGVNETYYSFLTIGGIVARNKGDISDTYATGMVRFNLSVTPNKNSSAAQQSPTEARVFAGGFVGVHESGTINRSYSNINFSDIAVIVKAHILQQNSRAHANVNIGGFIGELYTNANITNSFSTGNINARLIAEEILANGTRPANFEKLTLYGFSLETEFISNVYVSENQTLTVDQAINSFILNAHSINETTLKITQLAT